MEGANTGRLPTVGYAPTNGVQVYWESRGSGGVPLIVVHGGFGLISTFGGLLDRLADRRRVIAIELQGHGHTRDIDRPFSFEAFGEDIAGVIEHLDLGRADLLGYSLGAGSVLRCAIAHPGLVRRLVVVSIPVRRDGWFPEVRDAMALVGRVGFDQMKQTPLYEAWLRAAPDKEAFASLMDKTGALLRQPYDWSDEVKRLSLPTLLVYADADSISPAHAAEFFALLGGGLRDGGWDGSHTSTMALAILPGRTHYDVVDSPQLAPMLDAFLS